MAFIRRDSTTWPADVSRGKNEVIGDQDTVIGKQDDSAVVFVKLLFGDPYPQGIHAVELEAVVRRTATIEAVVR